MVLMIVIGIATMTWQTLGLNNTTAPYNINTPLGLFFSALLFLYLSIKLPKMAAQVVGEISSKFLPEKFKESGTPLFQIPTFSAVTTPLVDLASIQIATTIEPSLGQTSTSLASAAQIPVMTTTSSSISSMSQPILSKQKQGLDIGKASQTSNRSISETQLKQIRKTLLKNSQHALYTTKK